MSKFLFYTDFHLSGQSPINRLDDFPQSMLEKLEEIYIVIAPKYNVDFIIFGGDFFNTHKIYSYNAMAKAIEILNSTDLKTYAIIGQHDLRGYQKDTYQGSSLDFVERFAINYETIWTQKELDDVVLHPCHVFDNFEEMIKIKPDNDKCNIIFAHHLITAKKAVFKTHTLDSFLPCYYDAVLFGDYHTGMLPYYDNENTLVYSCGALARQAINDKDRDVKVGIIETGKNKSVKVQDIKLECAKSSKEAFKDSILVEMKSKPIMGDTDRLVDQIKELEKECIDIFDLITKTAKIEELPNDVLNYIMSKKK